MDNIELSAVLEMPISERLGLGEAIWDSIAEHPDALPLSEAEREELDRRWAAYVKNPDAGSPWSEVRARIASR